MRKYSCICCIVSIPDLPDFLYHIGMIFLKSYPLFLCGFAFDHFLKNGPFKVLAILMWITCSYGFFRFINIILLGLIRLYCRILPFVGHISDIARFRVCIGTKPLAHQMWVN